MTSLGSVNVAEHMYHMLWVWTKLWLMVKGNAAVQLVLQKPEFSKKSDSVSLTTTPINSKKI